MGNLTSATLVELDQLEQQYSRKRNRQSGNLRSRIGDQEKIIFCYYEIASGDILFYILTEIKLLFTWNGLPTVIWELKLNEVQQVTPNSGFFSQGGVTVVVTKGSAIVFQGIKDGGFLQSISGLIQKAKANLDVRLRSSTVNINASTTPRQISVAEQLEKLVALHKSGALTDDEYKRAKERILL